MIKSILKNSKFLFGFFLLSLVISPLVIAPSYSQSFDCDSSLTQRVDEQYQGPVVVDAYWTDASSASGDVTGNPTELEVGPGEGPATLAVVLVNRSSQDIYALMGFLKLPTGFEAGGISTDPSVKAIFDSIKGKAFGTPAIAAHYDKIAAGASFTLYFDVKIPEGTKVGTYSGNMITKFYTPGYYHGCNSALLTVPFLLPGKVILDIDSNNVPLSPKASNHVDFKILNRGSSDATGVVATIIGLGDTSSKSSKSSSSVVLQSSSTELVNLGSTAFNIGTIPANGQTTISTDIFPSSSSGGTVQNVDIQIIYGNAYGYRQTLQLSTGVVISPNPVDSVLLIAPDEKNSPLLITAGTVQDISLLVSNTGTKPLTDIVISADAESDSLKIVDKSKWVIPYLEPNQNQTISTRVFASTSLINTPTSLLLSEQYNTEGETKTDSTTIGGFVSGDIKLSLYDIEVNQVGNSLNVVGNILNRGSTTGKFATIELVSINGKSTNSTQSSRQVGDANTNTPQIIGQLGDNNANPNQNSGQFRDQQTHIQSTPQYLGDLSDDSSIPFSIPISPIPGATGTIPATFKIVYSDDLKQSHEIILDGTVKYNANPPQDFRSQRQQSGFIPIPIIIAIVAVAASAGVSIYFIKKNKKKTKKITSMTNDDIESLLDDDKK